LIFRSYPDRWIMTGVIVALTAWVPSAWSDSPQIYDTLKSQPNSFMIPEVNNLAEKAYLRGGSQQIYANADSLDFVGSNIIASGNVEIRYQDITIQADRAIVNIKTKDLDAKGNIVLRRNQEKISHLTLKEFYDQRRLPDRLVEIIGYQMKPTGEQLLICRIHLRGDFFKAERISGNLLTGAVEFEKFIGGYRNFFCVGTSASRATDGTITVKDATVTTCEYVEDEQEHYSVNCGTLVIAPRDNPSDLKLYNPNLGEHSYVGYNCTFRVGGVPVAWVPVVYKASDESPGIAQVSGGYDSDWGVWVKASKKFRIFDYPDTSVRVHTDYYSKHGFGYGAESWINTEESKTSLFSYFIYDKSPTDGNDDDGVRMSAQNQRYDMKFSNMTHVTDRLDFRGNFEKLSDYYMLQDFFSDRANNSPQPTTFASLEYQFDRLSVAGYVQPRVNDFYTEAQKLPELRIDAPRQELFKNLYYQGENSLSNMRMTFRDFNSANANGNGVDPESYSAVRFDSLHMFYYPINIDWLNLIPRAGGRLTYYNRSSKTKMGDDELNQLFLADDPDRGSPDVNVTNYDDRNGNIFRFAGEVGLEANTKIYRSWQDIKNSFWEIDGMRNVIIPYINYTGIPQPTTSANHLYYFDDTDRIERQNFIRFGTKNRLQTRRGEYGKEQIYEWASVETFQDFHLSNQSGYGHMGDLGSILKFNPTSRLSLTSLLLLNPYDSNKTMNESEVESGLRKAGLNCDWIDRWETTLRYRFIEDASAYISYSYQNPYNQRSVYSMGSTLAEIESGTAFSRSYIDRIQDVKLGMETLLPFDRNTKIGYEIDYDVEAGYLHAQKVKLAHTFHCFEVAVVAAQTKDRDNDGDKETKNSISATLTLTSIPGVKTGRSASADDFAPGK